MTTKGKLAYNYILTHISDGSWEPGALIPSENAMCAELGISRTCVRSAISQFTSAGILETHHGKGTYVKSADLRFLGQDISSFQTISEFEKPWRVQQARHMAEPAILAYAAEHATDELIASLERCNERMIENIGNQREFIHADMDFHRTLVRFIENPYLSEFYEPLLDLSEANRLSNDLFGYYDGIHAHRKFLDAIRARNPEKAHRVVVEYHKKMEGMMADVMEKFRRTKQG